MVLPRKSHYKSYNIPNLTEAEWAYIAGIFDGEGHVQKFVAHKYDTHVTYGYSIQIAQVNFDLPLYLKDKLGGSIYTRQPEAPNRQPVSYFEIKQRIAVREILKKLMPYLIVKRRQSQNVIDSINEQVDQVATHG